MAPIRGPHGIDCDGTLDYEEGSDRWNAGQLDDDDPVLEDPHKCVDCGVLGSSTPVMVHEGDSEQRCDSCAVSNTQFGLCHCGESDGSDELHFSYMVEITLQVKNKSKESVQLAKMRALEVLLGFPLVDAKEEWSHELITVTDSEGNEVPE